MSDEPETFAVRPIRSVMDLAQAYPPGFYETTVNHIALRLQSLSFVPSPALLPMAEQLFADIYAGPLSLDTPEAESALSKTIKK